MTLNQQPLPRVVEVTVPEMDPRVRIFRCGRVVDSWAVLTQRFVIVVDTMISPETASQIMAFLHSERASHHHRPLLVINTHGDWDHCWGNSLFGELGMPDSAPIVGHEATRRLFQDDKAEAWLKESRNANPGWYDSVRPVLPSIEFEKRLVIDGGDLTLSLIPTPGHTPDHVAIWIPEISVLIAGDAAELPMPFVNERSSLVELRRSLALMLDNRPLIVLYAHGGDIRSPSLIEHNIWYFDEAERRCREALASGQSSDAITPSSLGWPLEAVMPDGVRLDDPDAIEFYLRSHARAIGAVARQLAEVETERTGQLSR